MLTLTKHCTMLLDLPFLAVCCFVLTTSKGVVTTAARLAAAPADLTHSAGVLNQLTSLRLLMCTDGWRFVSQLQFSGSCTCLPQQC